MILWLRGLLFAAWASATALLFVLWLANRCPYGCKSKSECSCGDGTLPVCLKWPDDCDAEETVVCTGTGAGGFTCVCQSKT